nr:ABC transporter substrate-binding protein [Akkermansiaceae bacterium]
MRKFLTSLVLIGLALTGCRRETKDTARGLTFEDFAPVYNHYIENWLKVQQAVTEKDAAHVEAELLTAVGEAKTVLDARAKAIRLDREKWRFRLGLGNFLKVGNPSEVPSDLVWSDGMNQPEIGDPAAKKGGVFRRFIPSFPPTLSPFGDNSNHSFRGDLYDYIDFPLVTLHPETMEIIPGIANQWATSADGRTIYFRIDPEARYSDGVPVRARDFLLSVYVHVSDNIINPYWKQYYRENIAQVAMYDDLTVSISLPEAKIFAPVFAGAITPAPPHFYAEYGPDYEERYQWRFPPTTGAYEV